MFLTMSTTMVPFLYQTRTISRINRGQLGQLRYLSTRSYNHDSSRRDTYTPLPKPWASKAEDSRKETRDEKPSLGFEIRRVTNVAFGAATAPGASNGRLSARPLRNARDDDYTLQRQRDCFQLESRGGTTYMGLDDFAMPVEEEEEPEFNDSETENIFSEQQGMHGHEKLADKNLEFEELKELHGGRASTITAEERTAFQRIFSDIFERKKFAAAAYPYLGYDSSKGGNMDPKTRRKEAAKDEINDLIAKASSESILQNFPEVIRESAAVALGHVTSVSTRKKVRLETIDEVEATYQIAHEEEVKRLEGLREPERLRIEKLMLNAQSDFELWQVMEIEVFSLIPKFGLEQEPKKVEAPTVESKHKSKKKKVTLQSLEKQAILATEAKQPAPALTKDGVPLLTFYGPMYPSFLLLGLRLLDRSFAKPSSLSVCLLPKIKSLGFISHVLGASTQFYNELLRIYRYRLDDLVGMVKLLEEMEQAALDMDEETYEIVADVMAMQARVKAGGGGPNLSAVWKLSRYFPRGFKIWRDDIAQAIGIKDGRLAFDDRTRKWKPV